MAKIIAVVGATGVQGGGLARAILADPSGGFSVRAITRDARSKDYRFSSLILGVIKSAPFQMRRSQ